MIYEAKITIKKRLSTIVVSKWLYQSCFHMFSILTFCINICSFVNIFLSNVNISTWSLIRQHMFMY